MAKVDTSKIENFDSMSAEEKLNALLGYEFEAPKADESDELKRIRKALNDASSEAANYKRALREKQSEAERAEADRLENEKKLQDELAAYRTKERISTYQAKLMSVGFDSETASIMAKSLPEGVSDEYFAVTKTFLDNQRQTLMSEALDKQPKPSIGTPPTMTDAEKAEIANLRKSIGLNY